MLCAFAGLHPKVASFNDVVALHGQAPHAMLQMWQCVHAARPACRRKVAGVFCLPTA